MRWLPVLCVACSAPSAVTPTPGHPCEFGGKWVDQPRELRLAPDGAPYATLFQVTSAKVTLDGGVRALLVTPTVRLAGYVDPAELQLHASKPFVAGGFIAPAPEMAMRYVASSRGKLTVDIPLPYGARGNPPRETRACSDFAIEARTFEPRDAITRAAKSDGWLVENQSIPFALEPGKPPMLELQYEQGLGPRVDILDERDKYVRVVIDYHHVIEPDHKALLVGWIPVSAIHHEAHGTGGSWASAGDPARSLPRPSKNPRVTCPDEVSLDVEFGGVRKTVGAVAPNVEIELVGNDEVALPTANVEALEGARWLIAKQALASCTPTTRP